MAEMIGAGLTRSGVDTFEPPFDETDYAPANSYSITVSSTLNLKRFYILGFYISLPAGPEALTITISRTSTTETTVVYQMAFTGQSFVYIPGYEMRMNATDSVNIATTLTVGTQILNMFSRIEWYDINEIVPPRVTLIAPNGGESIPSPSPPNYNITWTCTQGTYPLTATPISIDISLDNGISWGSIAAGIANISPFAWVVPAYFLPKDKCLMRITAIDNRTPVNTTAVISASVFRFI